jgi:hypothetical protein
LSPAGVLGRASSRKTPDNSKGNIVLISDFYKSNTRILRRRISEGKALLENSPFLPHKRAVLGNFSSFLNQNRHFWSILKMFKQISSGLYFHHLGEIKTTNMERMPMVKILS